MKRFRKLLNANTSGKTILALFILTNAVYAYMLTITIPNTMRFSNDNRLLDMMPLGYDLSYVNTLFDALWKNWTRILSNESNTGRHAISVPFWADIQLIFSISSKKNKHWKYQNYFSMPDTSTCRSSRLFRKYWNHLTNPKLPPLDRNCSKNSKFLLCNKKRFNKHLFYSFNCNSNNTGV